MEDRIFSGISWWLGVTECQLLNSMENRRKFVTQKRKQPFRILKLDSLRLCQTVRDKSASPPKRRSVYSFLDMRSEVLSNIFLSVCPLGITWACWRFIGPPSPLPTLPLKHSNMKLNLKQLTGCPEEMRMRRLSGYSSYLFYGQRSVDTFVTPLLPTTECKHIRNFLLL